MTNGSPQEAGAPLAFREPMFAAIDIWSGGDGEPWSRSTTREGEEDTELLFAAAVEPDADFDGLGDLSQDCFPNHPFDQELCGRDLRPPGVSRQVRPHQHFLRSGVIVARVSSDEAGMARAAGQLEIKGNPARTFALRPARSAISSNESVALRIRIRREALRAARESAREGKRVVASVRLSVTDAAGLVGEKRAIVRPVVAGYSGG